jgi:ketosteroid isomerase-like protein
VLGVTSESAYSPRSTPQTSSSVTSTLMVEREGGDADAVAELLAPDVVFHSPLTARLRFEGKAEVTALHRDIFAVLTDLHTTEPPRSATRDHSAFAHASAGWNSKP